MKTNILLLLCVILLPLTGKSQDLSGKVITSGKIIYQEKVKLEIKLEGDAAQFGDKLPKEQVSGKVLYFNPDYSLYQAGASKNEDDALEQQSGVMKIRMVTGGQSDKTFCDFKNNRKTEQKDFMTRLFLVEDDLLPGDWKITGNYSTILGYNCQEALSQDTARAVRAWFTSAIPVSSGPAGYGGLPGMILQMDLNNGKRVITASSIDNPLTDTNILMKPKEGKKVTSAEFKKIVDDKMKEMGAEHGEGMNHVIIRYNN